jgi:ribonuclease Z
MGSSAPRADAADPHEIGENVTYQTADVTVTAIVADHQPLAQAFGYRVDYAGRAVVLSGDTRFSENIIRSARGVNVLVHEVAAANAAALEASDRVRGVMAMHTSPEEAGMVFRAARPYLAVYSRQLLFGITESELMRRTRRTYNGSLEIGHDLMVIEVQNEVQVRSLPSGGRRDAQ